MSEPRRPFERPRTPRWALAVALLAVHASARADDQVDPEPVRFVRIELPGEGRILSLAEVEVVRNGRQIGTAGLATQSSEANGGSPSRAIDGNHDGNWEAGSVTHTHAEANPWWELDLGSEQTLDRLVVWNRTDCCGERLDGFTLQLLDRNRDVVWERAGMGAPSSRVDLAPWDAMPVRFGPDPEQKRALQGGIDAAIQRGTAWLMDRQLRDGSYDAHEDRYRSGSSGLVLYTLIKCGVSREHPSVQRALQAVLHREPDETYAIATVLMALAAYDDPEHRAYMRDLLEMLLSYQGAQASDGKVDEIWGYPKNHTHLADLSNTQYAALGLRAAQRAGLDVPKKAWRGLIEGTLRYQCEVADVEVEASDANRSSTGRREVAGWPYRPDREATGSMTTAGLGVLAIAEQGLGDLPGGLRRDVDRAKRLGLAWLAHHFTVRQNVGEGGWLHYYLYGLERVGSLLGTDYFGEHDWYWTGAEFLVQSQEGGGSWERENVEATCFSLLFLSRATAERTTGFVEASAGRTDAWVADAEGDEVRWRITGQDPATMWITGFSDDVIRLFGWTENGEPELRVSSVEYLVDGEVVETAPLDPGAPWKGERFAVRHAFPTGGTYLCEVRVRVLDPGAANGGVEHAELATTPLQVEVDAVLEDWMLEYARHGRDNLLAHTSLEVGASSQNNDGQRPQNAFDGRHGTPWIAKPDDARPSLTVRLERPQRGNTLYLSHVNRDEAGRDDFARATLVRVIVNRGREYDVVMPDRDELKGVLDLDGTVVLRELEIQILDRTDGDRWGPQVGFAEVEWLHER